MGSDHVKHKLTFFQNPLGWFSFSEPKKKYDDSEPYGTWPLVLTSRDIVEFSKDGVLPVSSAAQGQSKVAFAIPLSSTYICSNSTTKLSETTAAVDNLSHCGVNRFPKVQMNVFPERKKMNHNGMANETDLLKKINKRHIAVYYKRGNSKVYRLIHRPSLNLSPLLTTRGINTEAGTNNEILSEYGDYPLVIEDKLQYLMIRVRVHSYEHYKRCVKLVVLIKIPHTEEEKLDQIKLKNENARLWRMSDWQLFWERERELLNRTMFFYRSNTVSLCSSTIVRKGYQQILTRNDRKRLRLVMTAVRGSLYRSNWHHGDAFYAEWRLTDSIDIKLPVFQLYYGFDKFAPLKLAPRFSLKIQNIKGHTHIVVSSSIPDVRRLEFEESMDKRLAHSNEKWFNIKGSSGAFFVALLVGNKSASEIKPIGRSHLLGFSLDTIRTGGLTTIWVPAFVTFLFFFSLLLIIPVSRTLCFLLLKKCISLTQSFVMARTSKLEENTHGFTEDYQRAIKKRKVLRQQKIKQIELYSEDKPLIVNENASGSVTSFASSSHPRFKRRTKSEDYETAYMVSSRFGNVYAYSNRKRGKVSFAD